MTHRTASFHRKTKETDIAISLDLDGTGKYSITTGLRFMDHMLEIFSKHSLINLTVKASGDLDIDHHHTVEDIGLTLGGCLHQALGNRAGINRYGSFLLPMDDSMSQVAVDLGGRPFLVYNVKTRHKKILEFELGLVEEFMRALVIEAKMNLHINLLYGNEPHHCYEAVFKGVARAMRIACEPDPRNKSIPSTKGLL
jgi:imidazoleglycerol-phosphate dehydratase